MPTAKSVKIYNHFTEYLDYASNKTVLDSKWLLQNHFYIEPEWTDEDPLPWELGVYMIVSANNIFAEEGIFIDLAKFKKRRGKSVSFEWMGEKDLEKEIQQHMRRACSKFAPDFLPTAMRIAVRAQDKAKKLFSAEKEKRAVRKKKKKLFKKVTKKKKC